MSARLVPKEMSSMEGSEKTSSLTGATTAVITCLAIALGWEVLYWIISAFEIIKYQDAPWVYRLWIVPILLLYSGLLVFFLVLRKNQKGAGNG